jgi:hypothetical protein
VSIQVTPVDYPPQFTPAGPQTVVQSQTLHLAIHAVDPDLPPNAVRYSLEAGSPPGAAVNPQTGALTWAVPQNFPVGITRLTVRATEVLPGGQPGLTGVETIAVEVIDFRLAVFASLDVGKAGAAAADLVAVNPLASPLLIDLVPWPAIAPPPQAPAFDSSSTAARSSLYFSSGSLIRSSFLLDTGTGSNEPPGSAAGQGGQNQPSAPMTKQPKGQDSAPGTGSQPARDGSQPSDDAKRRLRTPPPGARSRLPARKANDLALESLDESETLPIVLDEGSEALPTAAEEPAEPWLAAAVEELESWFSSMVDLAFLG